MEQAPKLNVTAIHGLADEGTPGVLHLVEKGVEQRLVPSRAD